MFIWLNDARRIVCRTISPRRKTGRQDLLAIHAGIGENHPKVCPNPRVGQEEGVALDECLWCDSMDL